MGVLVLAPNLLQLFIGWELVGLVSYLLIGYWYRKPSAARGCGEGVLDHQARRRGLPVRSSSSRDSAGR